MAEVVWIGFAFVLGSIAKGVGLPSLIGYLVAGFVIAYLDQLQLVDAGDTHLLAEIAHYGVLLLLFTVGLKLRLRNLLRLEILGTGILHFTVSVGVLSFAFFNLLPLSWHEALILASAVSFSSTVLVAKVLEGRRELRAFHGRVSIGILIVQDLLALGVVAFTGGGTPEPWALAVLLLPLLRKPVYWLLDYCGHDELLLLFGLLLALVAGGYGFEQLGLSSELGALAFGALIAGHRGTEELTKSLWSVKELLLVGFFLQIGIEEVPNWHALWFAVILVLLLPLKGALFFLLLTGFRLRARNAFRSALSLSNFSEFGLIVTSIALPEWTVPMALVVAFSFVASAPAHRLGDILFTRFSSWLSRFERKGHHPDFQLLSLGDAQVLVIGMGRTGTSAYNYLAEQRLDVVGIDSDPDKVNAHIRAGRRVEFADAEDRQLWQHLKAPQLQAVILAANDVETKVMAVRQLRERGFNGVVVSHAMYSDQAERITAAGADRTFQTMSEAGVGLAEHVLSTHPEHHEGMLGRGL